MKLFAFLILNLLSSYSGAAVTREEVNEIIHTFKAGMNPWMKEHRNGKVYVSNQWSSEDTTGGGAGARGIDGQWNQIRIHLTGAFSRNPLTTKGTVAFALCHELGHLTARKNTRSGENLADVFAVGVCLPIFYGQTFNSDVFILKAARDTADFRDQYHHSKELYQCWLDIAMAVVKQTDMPTCFDASK